MDTTALEILLLSSFFLYFAAKRVPKYLIMAGERIKVLRHHGQFKA